MALDDGITVAEAVERIRDLPYSRYPVADTSIDDIVGFVHVRDLFDAASDDAGKPVARLVRDIPYVPATARVLPTLTSLRARGHHIAVVVDEYGGTDGIVTLEDLVEEVVGEIFDEYDTAETVVVGSDTIDGRLNLQEFEERTGIELPRGSSDTIAGYVIEQLGRLAVVGDTVDIPGATLQVTSLDRRRIATVRLLARAEDEAGQVR